MTTLTGMLLALAVTTAPTGLTPQEHGKEEARSETSRQDTLWVRQDTLLVRLIANRQENQEVDSVYKDLVTDVLIRHSDSRGIGDERYLGATYTGNTLADEAKVQWNRTSNCSSKKVDFEFVNGGSKGPQVTTVASRVESADNGSDICVASVAWQVGAEPGTYTLRVRPTAVQPPAGSAPHQQTNRQVAPIEFVAVAHKELGFLFGGARVSSPPPEAFGSDIEAEARSDLDDQWQPIVGFDLSFATRSSRLQRYLLDGLRFSIVTSAENIADDLYFGLQLLPLVRHYTRWGDVGAGARAAKFPIQVSVGLRTGLEFDDNSPALMIHYSTGSVLSTITGAFK